MKLGYKISITIIMTLLVLVTSVGRSYAMWTITEKQEEPNLLSTGCLNITYNDLTKDNNVTSINLKNTYPIIDENGKKLKPYIVTITNDCTLAAKYNVYLSSFQGNTLDDEHLKVYFSRINDNTEWGPKLITDLESFDLSQSLKNTLEIDTNQIKNSYVLASGILNPTESKTYELRIWVDYTSSNATMASFFEAIVYMDAVATENHL